MYRERGNHIITQRPSSKAILDTCKKLEKQGFRSPTCRCWRIGLIDLDDLRRHLHRGPEKTILVSIMSRITDWRHQPSPRSASSVTRRASSPHHAVAGGGQGPVDVQAMNIDVLSISAHSCMGRRAGRAVCSRRPACRSPSNQRRRPRARMRSGNAERPRHVGWARPANMHERDGRPKRSVNRVARQPRAKLEAALTTSRSTQYGAPLPEPQHDFVYVEGESLMMGIQRHRLSSGSACTSATLNQLCAEGARPGRRDRPQFHPRRPGRFQH